KLGEVVMILDLHRQGLTVSAIARELGVDRKTVRRCIARGLETPVYGPRKPRKRLRGRAWPVVSLALEKRLFLNVRRKRLLVSPFGKKSCDINERLTSF